MKQLLSVAKIMSKKNVLLLCVVASMLLLGCVFLFNKEIDTFMDKRYALAIAEVLCLTSIVLVAMEDDKSI